MGGARKQTPTSAAWILGSWSFSSFCAFPSNLEVHSLSPLSGVLIFFFLLRRQSLGIIVDVSDVLSVRVFFASGLFILLSLLYHQNWSKLVNPTVLWKDLLVRWAWSFTILRALSHAHSGWLSSSSAHSATSKWELSLFCSAKLWSETGSAP